MNGAIRERHEPSQVREAMSLHAEEIMDKELAQAGLGRAGLASLPKTAPVKIQIARKLRQSTTLTLRQVASLLHAGAWRSLANALSKI